MLIQSKRVWIADQFVPAQIEIENKKIVNVLEYGKVAGALDYDNARIVPGFIDCHCHGANGFDTNDADEKGLIDWIRYMPSEGVTGFLPTTITQSKEVLQRAVANVADVAEKSHDGAEILGIHLEGPFLSHKYKGAHPEEHIVKPSIEDFKEYQKAARGWIKYITLATELDEDFKFTRFLVENNIVVSIGHSASTYEQAIFAYANGAKCQTHVYNGMSPFNHRENGLVGIAYRVKDMFGEIICDGNHSTLAALYNFFMAKGPHYGIVITDCLMAKGYEPGTRFCFGGNEIEIYSDGSAHLTDSKTLAGSTLKMNNGLRLLVEEALVPFDYAINACTINPARCLGIDNRKGKIGVGYDGDIVVLNDDYSVQQTYCLGKPML